MPTIQGVQSIIRAAIRNNKAGVIGAMNSSGYYILSPITEEDLYNKVWGVFSKNGLDGLKTVLNKVKIEKENITQTEINSLQSEFTDTRGPNERFLGINIGLSDVTNWFGDLVGGSGETIHTPVTQTSQSPISPSTVIFISVLGIIAIILTARFVKGGIKGLAITAELIIIVGIIAYAIFGKTTTTTGGGSTTEQHGGIGSIFLSLFGL